MSALLDLVREAAELREGAQAEFVKAVQRARSQHTLQEIGAAAGMTKQGVSALIHREEKRA